MANGSCTLVDSEEAYAGVIGMETVHLGFLLAEMNRLKSVPQISPPLTCMPKPGRNVTSLPVPNLANLKVKNLSSTAVSTDSVPLEPVSMNTLDRNYIAWVTPPAGLTLNFGSPDILTATMSTSPTMSTM